MKLLLKYSLVWSLLFLYGYNIATAGMRPVSFDNFPALDTGEKSISKDERPDGLPLYALWSDDLWNDDDDAFLSAKGKNLLPGFSAAPACIPEPDYFFSPLKNNPSFHYNYSLFPDRYIVFRVLRI